MSLLKRYCNACSEFICLTSCLADDEEITSEHDGKFYCQECLDELKHGIITPPNDVLLIGEDSCDEDRDDDEVAYLENATRDMEDNPLDMDAEHYGWRDTTLDNEIH
jgi:hypothetical protein